MARPAQQENWATNVGSYLYGGGYAKQLPDPVTTGARKSQYQRSAPKPVARHSGAGRKPAPASTKCFKNRIGSTGREIIGLPVLEAVGR
jgi:hypothetical protein